MNASSTAETGRANRRQGGRARQLLHDVTLPELGLKWPPWEPVNGSFIKVGSCLPSTYAPSLASCHSTHSPLKSCSKLLILHAVVHGAAVAPAFADPTQCAAPVAVPLHKLGANMQPAPDLRCIVMKRLTDWTEDTEGSFLVTCRLYWRSLCA